MTSPNYGDYASHQPPQTERYPCPICKEQIHTQALACPFCQRDLHGPVKGTVNVADISARRGIGVLLFLNLMALICLLVVATGMPAPTP